ncbi:MAG: tetratricopeptide (TPR) repeat protein [Pirellulaceae bacterium]|jgi:tetratricopeptide (TPR) repeat protein
MNCLVIRAAESAVAAELRAIDRLLADATDQVLDTSDFLAACLISGGTNDGQSVVHWRSVFLQHQLRLQKLIRLHAVTKPELPRYIFQYLQAEVLVGPYETLCTDVRRTLDDGSYNCVTGSVLYTCLCRGHGIPVEIHAGTGHVFCRLKSTEVIIETTCSNWFQLTADQQDLAIYQRSRCLSEVQLLGKVFYNRGIQAAEKEQFSTAVKMFRYGVQLDRDDVAAKENLLATLNNWALHECQLDHFQRAVKLLEIGWSLDQQYEPLLNNDIHIHQRWVTKLCRNGRWGEAMEILEQCCRRREDVSLFHQMKHSVERNRAVAESKNGV